MKSFRCLGLETGLPLRVLVGCSGMLGDTGTAGLFFTGTCFSMSLENVAEDEHTGLGV